MNDSRFFEGYVWCSYQIGCTDGLCVKAETAEEAALRYADRFRRMHKTAGPVTVYTMTSPDNKEFFSL